MFYLYAYKQLIYECKQKNATDLISYKIIATKNQQLFPMGEEGMLVAPLVQKDLKTRMIEFINEADIELFKQYLNTSKDREFNRW